MENLYRAWHQHCFVVGFVLHRANLVFVQDSIRAFVAWRMERPAPAPTGNYKTSFGTSPGRLESVDALWRSAETRVG